MFSAHWQPTKRLYYPLVLIAVLWIAWIGNVVQTLTIGGPFHFGKFPGTDFVVYYSAGESIRVGEGERLYDADFQDGLHEEVVGKEFEGQFLYHRPPLYALVFIPFSLLPFTASYLVWCALGLVSLWASVRLLGVHHPRTVFLWSFAWPPIFFAFSFGQTILVNLILLSAVFWLWKRRHLWAAGLSLSLLMDKPHLVMGVVLLFLLNWRRDWRVLSAFALGCLALAGLSVLLFPQASASYLDVILNRAMDSVHSSESNWAKMHSVVFFFQMLWPGQPAFAQLLAVTVAAIALAGFVSFWMKNRTCPELSFAAAVVLSFLVTPYALLYDWALLLIPAILLARHLPEHDDHWKLAYSVLGTAAYLGKPLMEIQLEHLPFAFDPMVPALLGVSLYLFARLSATDPRNKRAGGGS